jgi:ATP-binding cassette subfamily B protein
MSSKKQYSMLRLIPEVLRATPLWVFLDISSTFFSAVFAASKTIVLQLLFDSVQKYCDGSQKLQSFMAVCSFAVLVYILNEIFNGICNYTWLPLGLKVKGAMNVKLFSKISKIDAVEFENADMLNFIEKAKLGASNVSNLYNTVSSVIFFYCPYFLIIGTFLYSLKPLLIISLFIIFIPQMLIHIFKEKIYSTLVDVTIPLERELKYFEKTVCDREYFKETRLLGIYSYLTSLHREVFSKFSKETWKTSKKTQKYEILMKLITLLGYYGIIFLLFASIIDQSISVGAFVSIFSSIGLIIKYMDDVINKYMGRITVTISTLNSYVELLEYHEDELSADVELNNSTITFKDVSFHYPNAKNEAIKHLNFTIKPGDKIAVVGANGAGKTTLTRLLTGIYKPTSGEVLINGVSAAKINKNKLYSIFSSTFQKHVKYQLTLKENIYISNTHRKLDEAAILFWLKEFALPLSRFPSVLDTNLSREFSGIDLSGGEWQKVSFVRGEYREHQVMVLDEPTSAIDPLEEAKIYEQFARLSKDKTTVFVTHRLGSVKLADYIIVLDQGRIHSIGTHNELITQDELYAKMYHSQADKYDVFVGVPAD